MNYSTNLHLPKKVIICEVAPRDGFQSLTDWIPTEDKMKIIEKLANTGIQTMEITSFVHPKAIPQLRDAEEIVERSRNFAGMNIRALVPNLIGAQRAINVGIKKFKLMLSATDSHSISNANCLTEEGLNNFDPILDVATKNNVKVGGSISVAFGCPYEGKVPLERLEYIIGRYKEMGIKEISLADSSGMANPKQIYETLGILQNEFSDITFSMHFHNTRGMAMANVVAALQQGVTLFDSSIAGLGGCPYAPGATGNVATEDVVHMLGEMEIETGINFELLLEAAKETKRIIGKDGGSFLLQAGPNSKLHNKPKQQVKMESN